MGSPQVASNPPHEVTLTRAFWIQKTQVTQAQWVAVMGTRPSHFTGNDLRPVERVSWDDVQFFLRELNQKTGLVFRLPTEAEWEYACRAGTAGEYAGNLDDLAWYDSNSGGSPQPVASRRPNGWDLYDMHGNVWEWCQDLSLKLTTMSAQDPTGAASGSERVLRGGSWFNNATNARSAFRFDNVSSCRFYHYGFRVVRTA
jgi:formylglycine-generating enzyme required for sulfatase activity